jgi:hypothetical protein
VICSECSGHAVPDRLSRQPVGVQTEFVFDRSSTSAEQKVHRNLK